MLMWMAILVPGWDKLKNQADDFWGGYEREIKTNNPDVSISPLARPEQRLTTVQFPDKPSAVCITNNDVDITINGERP